jgi:aminopeptidase YwaD
MNTKRSSALLISLLLTTAVFAQQPAFQIEPSAEKLREHVSYLASDRLDGRRTGTTGANEAARYIAVEFSRLGLKPIVQTTGKKEDISQYLQTFPYVARVTLGQGNALNISNGSKTLAVGSDWTPLGFSKSNRIDATPTVFAGFGITSAELKYDDYFRGATGKVAVIFSGTPDGDNPHGQFARYEDPRFKAIAARNAGAAALVIISREKNLADDRLSIPRYDNAGDAGIPVIVVSRQIGATLLEMANEEVMTRAESEMATWARGGPNCSTPCGVTKNFNLEIKSTLTLATDVVRREAAAYNVIAVLEGSDPKLKNETIIVGAHYDHLGRGGQGSLAQKEGEIHHGADDNASGVAGVLELARIFTMPPFRPKRTLVFMAFSGEEEGLLGSNYYVTHPVLPLANTIAMINMDMIGRMKDRKVVIGGIGTAKEWRDIVNASNQAQTMLVNVNATGSDIESANSKGRPGIPIVTSANGRTIVTASSESAFDLTLQEDGYGPSDHSSFYSKQIPVLFFWTGTHSDYHKPSDTFDKINYEDEAKLLAFVTRIILALDRDEKRLTFTTAKSDATPRTGGFRVYLGTIPNYAETNDGLLLDGVREDSPAAKAGLKAGDKIVKIGSREIKNVYDYTFALGELKAGQEYPIEVMRGTERLSLKITPETRK